jgi:FtsX-like permease family/Biotin-lipoyl like
VEDNPLLKSAPDDGSKSSPTIDSDEDIPASQSHGISRWQISWRKFGLLGIFIAIGVGILVAKNSNLAPTDKSSSNTLTQTVERKTMPVKISANGTVKAYRSINLSPKTAGTIKTLLVKEGDRVRQGQVIAMMDDASLRGELSQYQGQLVQQQANLRRLQAGNRPQDIAKAEAQLAEVTANLHQLQAGNRRSNLFISYSAMPQDRDDTVYIPLTSMSARIVGNNSLMGISISGIYIKGRDETQLEIIKFQVANILRLRHNIDVPSNDDFKITNQADILKTFNTILSLFTTMIVAIAGISLVVGGIGIANIMLVSVVERTREIGIRKALGATDRAILSQFLTEAVVISVVGGSIGIVLGISLTFLAATVLNFAFIVSGSAIAIAIGFGLSTAVGLVAGVIPARNAAKLDPIVALRSN